MKKLRLIITSLIITVVLIACGADSLESTKPGTDNLYLTGTIIFDNTDLRFNGLDLTNSKLYIKVYNSSNEVVNIYYAENNPKIQNIGNYYFSNISIAEKAAYKVLMYIKAGSDYIALDDLTGNVQYASIDLLKNTAGYNRISSGEESVLFEYFANGYPVQGNGTLKTGTNPSLEAPIQEP